MKTLRILLFIILISFIAGCSNDKFEEINKDYNNAYQMPAKNILTDAELKTAFEVAGTDIAWYATVYIEHSAGTWAQSATADKRVAQNDASLFNNNWVSIYNVLEECKQILAKTSATGPEPDLYWARGIAYVLSAYNLAYATDMWGEVPWDEALQGNLNMQPAYNNQSYLYPKIQELLDSGIVNLEMTGRTYPDNDYIYGGDETKWIKAAWSLKARYYMRLTQRDPEASAKALACIPNGFTSGDDNFMFRAYDATSTGENPWYQFLADRSHLSSGKTLYDLMVERNDTLRIHKYFTLIDGAYVPAPNGTATENQGGVYSTSLITEEGQTAPTPLMTYHELKFIEAEAKFRTNDPTWQVSLGEAIAANYIFHDVSLDGLQEYLIANVLPRLTPGNELNEILTQKYIAFYEAEAVESYNDYRRTGVPTMNNPNNLTATGGFVNRFPYAISETTANPSHVPDIDVFVNKVWWAGGDELVK
jgi:hypothetical protein